MTAPVRPPQFEDTPELPSQEPPGSVALGVGLTILLHLAFQPILAFVADLVSADAGFGPFLFIGVSQLLYLVPATIVVRNKPRPATAKGLMIGAGLTFLLNAACFGLVFTTFRWH